MNMKREIKFRVWDGNEMVFFADFDILNTGGFWGDGCEVWCMSSHYKKGTEYGYFHDDFKEDIRNVTLMQFAGLKDRNGKDIYEGDVFTVGANKKVFECRFERGCFVAYLDGKQYGIIGELHEMYITVIGNIHENPELKKP